MNNYSEIPTGSTTKNDLGVDYISRADVNRLICEYRDDATETGNERDLERAYGANAVGELISELPSVTPQEPFKPMVEIDLYSVIKQKYIERNVLDKIRAEIERQEKWLMDAGYNQYNVDIALDTLKSVVDKCKAESENP